MIKPRYSNFVLLMGEFTCTVPPYQGHRTYWHSSYKTPKHQKSLAFFDSRHRCSHYHFASFTRESRVRHSTSRVQLPQRSAGLHVSPLFALSALLFHTGLRPSILLVYNSFFFWRNLTTVDIHSPERATESYCRRRGIQQV